MVSKMDDELVWKIINSHFKDNPQSLVRHHIESYDDFFKVGIFQIFKEKNPIVINSEYDETIQDFKHQCIMYFGGKDGSKIYFGKPIIYDDNNTHYMFPNEARLRNMTYGMTIHYDIDIEYIDYLEPGEAPYILTPDMVDIAGGSSKYKITELDGGDYSNEIAEHEQMIAGNFKTETLDKIEGGGKKPMDLTSPESVIGGGPKKVEKQRRVKSVEVEMTANMSAQLKEAQEKSVKDNFQTRTITIEKMFLGKFPIMMQSNFCVLNGLPKSVRFNMGECRHDVGGYFIIDGKEKTVIPQEKFADNMLYIRDVNDDSVLYSAEIRSVSENVSKPIRTLSVKLLSPGKKYTFENMVVNIPNVRSPVPLFVVFRALGIISDKAIIQMCLLDLDKYENMIDLFIPSIHDAGQIMTQHDALIFIASLTKFKTISYTMEVLSDYFIPHVGETNFIQKAYYLGYIIFRLLSVYKGIEPATDRDNYKYKRIELVGSLVYDLFREYYTIQQREIHLKFEEKLYFNKSLYGNNLPGLIDQHYQTIFKERHVELGFRKAFKGNWGSQIHTKRVGVVQDINRLSFNTMISHLRKTNLPLDSSAKLVGPRVLHGSQWGFIDPLDTPDGANIGLHKTLAITTTVSRGYSREPMIQWLRENLAMKLVEECGPLLLSTMTKVIVNGLWAGSIHNPIESINKIRLFRRNALIPIYTSATFEIKLNTIFIYTDSGRVCRPIFYRIPESTHFSIQNKEILKRIHDGDFTWSDLVTGFNRKRIANVENILPKIYELRELYVGIESESNPAKIQRFTDEQAIIDYIDPSESENSMILLGLDNPKKDMLQYTHMEIHESLIFGVMSNQIIYPENNPPTRNAFSCGQSKQAVSLYHTNYNVRMDKTAVILNNGQKPLVKSRFMEYINEEENPYGENAIVAIMCYTGYNVEDAVLINEASIQRGLFNTTYYTVYESHEESSKNANTVVDKRFTNIENEDNVRGTKPGYDYSKLDKFGIIKENTPVDDKTVLIGLTSNNVENKELRMDMSKTPKKGQLGIVDKTFITEGDEGQRIAKVRLREIRIPNLGDKMASRSGQKGTIGMIIPEKDMPFTKEGIRPDIIINPHALPTRMTIGQLVECIVGKACASYGGFGDCTAFNNKESKIRLFGELLTKVGFHSSGNDLLYDGMSGQQIESDIFIGPTYYMRLKHMVKDKINYRAQGPRTALTRQPVSGRANDGGLRIGEMERDVLISHGMNAFLKESMLERGDKYYMAICNQTGMIAVFNPSKNLFMSPMADGPLRFIGTVDGKSMNIENITKFGRSFSVICVPYSFKLLLQELQTVNIQMRIITEDNIHQLDNLSFSKNIEKLTQIENVKMKEIVRQVREKALKSFKHLDKIYKMDENSPEYIPALGKISLDELSPIVDSPPYASDIAPTNYSPLGTPRDSPQFNPNTPESSVEEFNPWADNMKIQAEEKGIAPPMTPPGSPPSANKIIVGGNSKREFANGDLVYYRGSNQSNRIWSVKDNNGGKFITIETDSPELLDTPDEMIKVVSCNDIFHCDELNSPYNNNNNNNNQYQQTSQYKEQPINGMLNGMMPHEININPIIKIVNGPDNSVETADNTNKIPSSHFTSDNYPQNNIADTLQLPHKHSDEKKLVIDNGNIDFNNLVIKKL
jgi:DNA-directed RNA polymerase II subunit RPB2